MLVKILLYISIFFISFILGGVFMLLGTPSIGTLTIEETEEKDIYTILLNKEPKDMKLRNGQYTMLKVRFLKSKE